MFIGIVLAFVVIFAILPLFLGGFKKILEIVSSIAKWCICAGIVMFVNQKLQIEFGNTWGNLAFVVIGAFAVSFLISLLAGKFRLIGFSINYFIDSFIVLFLAAILGEKVEINFFVYVIVLFLLPRIMWLSDRTSTSTEYSHSDYSILSDITTSYYNIVATDKYEDFGDSWRFIPLQIIIASIFYVIGSVTIVAVCPIEYGWLLAIYAILATAINVIFDLFVFRRIDELLN